MPSSLLQVTAFFLAWISLWLPVAAVLANVFGWQPPKPLAAEQKLPLLASLYIIAPLVLWGVSQVTGASFSDYGFAWNFWILRSLSVGFGLSLLSLVVLFSIQTALGWITWQPTEGMTSVLLPTLLLALWLSGTEELVFRGFVLTQLQHDYSSVMAAAISSLIFAVLHLVWERRETIPQLPGLWLMGMVLVLARYLDDGSLGLAWGLHSGWVWAIASLESAGLIAYTSFDSEWITGKNGKPLTGVAGIVCLLTTGVIMWLYLLM